MLGKPQKLVGEMKPGKEIIRELLVFQQSEQISKNWEQSLWPTHKYLIKYIFKNYGNEKQGI